MTVAVVNSRAISAAEAPEVRVEVHLANGLPAFTVVGLADTEVRESRERVRAALQTCGFTFPAQRITVSLAPADLPKESGRFDLPIALGVLCASGQLPPTAVANAEFAGELSLTGELRPIRGALAMACAIARQYPGAQRPTLFLPSPSAAEAALASSVAVFGACGLLDLCAHLRHAGSPAATDSSPVTRVDAGAALLAAPTPPPAPDLAEVVGQAAVRRGLEIAAAGGHHALMMGPPGAGKSMLAARLPGILPPMTDAEALEAGALISLTRPGAVAEHWRRRPFRAPHHSSSAAALVGGGNPPRPGEVTLAHHGVLFLDELPEFDRRVLDMLREPLERGCIQIARAGHSATFPACCQLVAAMNPCPCGWSGDPSGRCRCTPEKAERYRRRVSGPLLDRIDLHLEVSPVAVRDLRPGARHAESSATVAARVRHAHRRQLARQPVCNARLSPPDLDRHACLDADGMRLLEAACERMHSSARGHAQIRKVARSIADLAGADAIGVQHLAEAIQYRRWC
ncbi:YifB family Mg chelatase-like AAA ATPase [Chitinasiproducens palmae]|uniref:Magnesium chelatase family protein n=1 Tax=Chitinasiproducens palmae TaxID=1770053 RepID=A0A1H2PNK3_9BURK|nr:YifB family Mg chelatase-like AAA ATPase [Chitinasiproducens palmae]SDV48264.1 magnesium chelatase family protein [Chitinasiproducens palmae]